MMYCGYIVILIVIIFIFVLILWLLLFLLIIIIIINQGNMCISIKIFQRRFFSDFEILINVWRILFLFIVVIISIRVIIFSISYMSRLKTFYFVFLYLRFVVRIMWLILNNNFYWIIFGWDGLGVVSFLLIVFYINHERINNGLFTLFQNRIGDLFFVLFIVGTIEIIIWNTRVLKWGVIFLILGRCVKRAQFPFNSWLLSAIRAPTPISSLVHSSTLVVAGVYILLQFRYCLVDVLEILKFIRIIRLILSSLGLLTEFDIKKLVAYSTINHVSLILFIIRFKLYKVVYFHLNIHAIFKSLIFICFGFVMLSSYHRQDKRLVRFVNLNPLIKIIYYFSCMCLAGLPILRAFFSKDFIIEKLIENSKEFLYVFLLLLFLRTRIYYRLKLLNLSFYQYPVRIIEKSSLGLVRVFIIIIVIILIVNIYISLVFRLSLEFLSFKIFIYALILFFRIIRLLRNVNYKFNVYDKIKNFKEIWFLKVRLFDSYIYWNMFVIMSQISNLISIKLFVLINWWVIIMFIVVF